MFTGIVENMGTIQEVESTDVGARIRLAFSDWDDLTNGESIAVNGVCLTLLPDSDDGVFYFDAMQETLKKTNLGALAPGAKVNLERALRMGDRLGGHFVTGHVDATGTVDAIEEVTSDPPYRVVWIRLPEAWTRQMIPKGSITVDGISLTLVDVEAERFSVHLIPYTLDQTTLGIRSVGDRVNVETDMLGKIVLKAVGQLPTPAES